MKQPEIVNTEEMSKSAGQKATYLKLFLSLLSAEKEGDKNVQNG